MSENDKLFLELGRLTFAKLDALAASPDPAAPELDFFLGDGQVLDLLNRINASQDKTCPACGSRNPAEDIFCANCGVRLAASQDKVCRACGLNNPVEATYCINCGSNLSAPGMAGAPS
jgi:ribosomal protein L40E